MRRKHVSFKRTFYQQNFLSEEDYESIGEIIRCKAKIKPIFSN
jgi:hypothetical protein